MASNNLKQVLKKDTVIERDYIIFTGTAERIYLWFKLYDDCYKDGNFIQNFIMKRIEIDYQDNDIEFKNKEFKAYKEYKLEGNTWETIEYGTFIVTDVKESDTKESIKVTAYDYALKFAIPYETELNYESGEVTLAEVLQECATKCGVELGTTTFTNSTFIVDSNQFVGEEQFGNVVSAVSGMACSFGKIVNDKLCLIFTNQTDVVIDSGDYEEFEDKRDSHPITIVSLGNSQVEGENITMRWEEGIEQYGENYLIINDNPFAYTQAKREALITAIYDKAKGFAYSSMALNNCLYPYLKCGDLITIKNKEGQNVQSIVLRRTFEETEVKLEAPSIIKATVNYQNVPSAMDIAKRAEIIANKAEAQISQVTSKVEELDMTVESNYTDITNKFNDYTPTSKTVELENSVTKLQTDTYTKTEINQKLTDGSVTKVQTISGKFDLDGMHYEKTGAETATTINEIGVKVDNTKSNEELLFAGYDDTIKETIVRTENLTVRKYLVCGNGRFEDYAPDGCKGTGYFIL